MESLFSRNHRVPIQASVAAITLLLIIGANFYVNLSHSSESSGGDKRAVSTVQRLSLAPSLTAPPDIYGAVRAEDAIWGADGSENLWKIEVKSGVPQIAFSLGCSFDDLSVFGSKIYVGCLDEAMHYIVDVAAMRVKSLTALPCSSSEYGVTDSLFMKGLLVVTAGKCPGVFVSEEPIGEKWTLISGDSVYSLIADSRNLYTLALTDNNVRQFDRGGWRSLANYQIEKPYRGCTLDSGAWITSQRNPELHFVRDGQVLSFKPPGFMADTTGDHYWNSALCLDGTVVILDRSASAVWSFDVETHSWSVHLLPFSVQPSRFVEPEVPPYLFTDRGGGLLEIEIGNRGRDEQFGFFGMRVSGAD